MATLLKNGLIYDGTGADAFVGDILIENDRIVKVGKSLEADGAEVQDLAGLSVSSGFFDPHSHSDWYAIKKDPVPYFEPFIRQGITSFVTGNCGLSEIGLTEGLDHAGLAGAGLFRVADATGTYPDFKSFSEAIDGRTPCNIASLVGHATARTTVAGYSSELLTAEQEEKMLAILERDLQQGAAGISMGLAYLPTIYSPIEELKKVAALCEKYDKPLTVHARAYTKSGVYDDPSDRSDLLRALDEMKEAVSGLKVKLQWSHAIFVGRATFGDYEEFNRVFEEMRAEGVDIMFNIFDVSYGVSVISMMLPGWYQALDQEEKDNPDLIEMMEAAYKTTLNEMGLTWNDLVVAYVGEGFGKAKYEGMTVQEIADEEGTTGLKAYLKVCKLADYKGRLNIGPYNTPQILSDQMRSPYALYMTDAWPEDHGVQNIALYNCFPRFLQDSLNGLGDTMPMTIRKMTGGVADRFSVKDRGYVKEGYYADLTVFDEAACRAGDRNAFKAFGISKVFINGKLVLDGRALNEEVLRTSGRAISI